MSSEYAPSVIRAHRSDVTVDGHWQGVRLDVTHHGPAGLAFEAAAGGRLRLQQGSATVLLARFQPSTGFRYINYLRPPGFSPVLPPMRAAQARDVAALPDRRQSWAYRFAQSLTTAGLGPLYQSSWVLRSGAPYLPADPGTQAAARWRELVRDSSSGTVDRYFGGGCPVICMRALSLAGDSRVKSYRKQCREGILSPVLVWWVSSLGSYLLLDGHDRLAASLAEGGPPPVLSLAAIADGSAETARYTYAIQRYTEVAQHIVRESAAGGPAGALAAAGHQLSAELGAVQCKLTRARAGRYSLADWERAAELASPQWARANS